MPTYEYECAKCGNTFDVFQKMTDEPVATCPKCGGRAQRLISSGAGFIFKGSGFYATDYKKREKNNAKDVPPPCPKSDKCKSCPMDKNKDT